jgi:integrase
VPVQLGQTTHDCFLTSDKRNLIVSQHAKLVSGISSGAMFRGINRHGQVQVKALTSQVVALQVKRYIALAGLDASLFSGHSLRAGLCTSAALNGPSERKIMDQTRHRSTAMVRKYIRDGNLFRNNAAGAAGL